MKYGYARVSTRLQATEGNSLEAQAEALTAAGAETIYVDALSGKSLDRPELHKLVSKLVQGDMLIVTKLDRLARSAAQASALIDSLLSKGISIHVLNMGVLDDTPTGRLICNVLLSFAEYERDMILERTQEGKAVARQNPNYREGRPPKFTKEQVEHALDLLEDHSYKQVTDMTGISRSTLKRRMSERRKKFM